MCPAVRKALCLTFHDAGWLRRILEDAEADFESIAAKAEGEPCVTHIGLNGAGHFVKMVHNGIEYSDMQLIAESYDLMRRGLGMTPAEIGDVFEEWNKTELDSI